MSMASVKQLPEVQQRTNISRRYYERELGAGMGPSLSMKEAFGYSEPLRRFIQRESFEPQANEIPNTMPSWLPGDDYMTNFKVGDPYVRVDDGYARLPGAGYEALHPELKGLNPEDYPDIHKLRILADVAPYSREYNNYRQKIASEAHGNTELQIELEKIIERVRQVKESSAQRNNQVFSSCLTQNPSRTRAGHQSQVQAMLTIRLTSVPTHSLPALSLQAPSSLYACRGQPRVTPPACRAARSSRPGTRKPEPASLALPHALYLI
jgi:hypothetical protein